MRILYHLFFFLLLVPAALKGQCTLPIITSSTGQGIYCTGDQVTLSINGNLGDATQWEWSAGTCGQNIFNGGTGNSVTIQVTGSLSYFVRGVGGCVPVNGACHEIKITLDDEPPTPDCSDDVMVMVAAGETQATVEYAIPGAVDNCPGGVKIELVEGIRSGGAFPLGVTPVVYRFTDARNNTTTCSFDVSVKEGDEGSTGPMITCPDDLTVSAEAGKCGAVVQYSQPSAIGDSKVTLTSGLGSGAFFPVGTSIEVYTATDPSGNSMSCSFKITVKEIQGENKPPAIVLSKISLTIWPPNHQIVLVNIKDYIESVTGSCALSVDDVVITKVTSDEEKNSTGDGHTAVDIKISDECRSVDLRAERKGNGNGRVYTIHLGVSDADGNLAKAQIKAFVPHDNGKGNSNKDKEKDSDRHDDDDDGKEHKKNDDDDDNDDDGKGHKNGRNGDPIDNGPHYEVQGCEPSVARTSEPPPVYYSYEEEVLTSSIEPYPNPFNSTLQVSYTSIKNEAVSLDLYNLRGERAKQLFRGELHADQTYNWQFDVHDIDKQIYLLVIKGRNTYAAKKIVKH